MRETERQETRKSRRNSTPEKVKERKEWGEKNTGSNAGKTEKLEGKKQKQAKWKKPRNHILVFAPKPGPKRTHWRSGGTRTSLRTEALHFNAEEPEWDCHQIKQSTGHQKTTKANGKMKRSKPLGLIQICASIIPGSECGGLAIGKCQTKDCWRPEKLNGVSTGIRGSHWASNGFME